MKRESDDLNLRNAFAPIPEDCRSALMDAANSVREEPPAKRSSFRALLIAAVIIVATMAVAFAAQQLGWVDFYGTYYGITLPKAAEESLNATQPISYEVGPMTFTYKQLLTDRHIVLSSAEVHMTDGSEALFANDSDLYEAVDALNDVILEKYKLESGTTWVEAARQLNLPLYGVRALVEVAPEYVGGDAMEDALWNEDGSIVYFNMPSLNTDAVKDSLPVTLYMAVHRYDPDKDEVLVNEWTDRQELTLPVAPLLAEKTYRPDGESGLTLPESKEYFVDENGTETFVTVPPIPVTLTDIRAEQYATGIYLTATFVMPDDLDANEVVNALYQLTLCDASGDSLPRGLNLSVGANASHLPTATLQIMTSAETLPEGLLVTGGTTGLIVK